MTGATTAAAIATVAAIATPVLLPADAVESEPAILKYQDTIAAIATPPGRGGIGVVRLSGSRAREIAGTLCSIKGELTAWHASLGELRDDEGNLVDQVVLTYFAAPRSYTAEEVVEISCHGAPVILRYCIERTLKAGARLADPGEFTLRAYLNGRIDLPQAEAVRDLIDATTLYQAKVAAQQTQGSVSRRVMPVKSQLIELISLLEAGIDFAEDDISVAPVAEILRRLDPILAETRSLARSFLYGNLVRSGFSLAIVGRPNAGKSSLFNRLLEQDRAIVTDIPGTTRDLVTEVTELAGIPVRLADTAGIRETTEIVEQLGIERSMEAMADSDLTIVVVDGSAEPSVDDEALIGKALVQGRCLVVLNKCDLPGFASRKTTDKLSVSATTGQGIPELRQAILEKLAPMDEMSPQEGFITSVRHKNLLDETIQMLERARSAANSSIPHEMLLLDLYCALQPLDAITGATTGDDILQKIFNTFCIGK